MMYDCLKNVYEPTSGTILKIYENLSPRLKPPIWLK